ncbi:hypothetical protein LJK87_12160 [Paenibacillus sp. P25]|nr:hypothetical protein LJK87_12160 [Paenibacillus sp. P25]
MGQPNRPVKGGSAQRMRRHRLAGDRRLREQQCAPFIIAAGIGFSTIFPTITSIACTLHAKDAGVVLGYLFTASGIGSLLANSVIGAVSSNRGLQTGFALIFVFLFAVLLCIGCVAYLARRLPEANRSQGTESSSTRRQNDAEI